jgi:hypothetical protein
MKTKLLGVVAGLAFLATASAADADTFYDFSVSGTFSDGGILTGSLTLDSSGTPLRGSLFVSGALLISNPPGANFVASTGFAVFPGGPDDPNVGPGFLTEIGTPLYGTEGHTRINLTFNVTAILSGGIVPLSGDISWPEACTETLINYCIGGGASLRNGSLTLIAIVTPIPSALPLFATGLSALGLLGWHRKRKAA